MLDFIELPQDGELFELLVRELLFSYGMTVQWSGRGPDGGRDLLCTEMLDSLIAPTSRRWLIQCKHFAHANRSVGVDDLDKIVDSCAQHNATGYLLACSTQPSSAVVNRLENITANPSNGIIATYWDGVTIERLISKPRHWAIAQRFFPVSADTWRIYATERPNDFVAHFRGYVFHLTNRIGSKTDHLLPSIESRISDLEEITSKLPDDHFLCPRAVWFDDKNGGFTWYVDYMYPSDSHPHLGEVKLAEKLRSGWALEDGQFYDWDIRFVQYWSNSDHYDRDHYQYYVRYIPNFLEGARRHDNDDDDNDYVHKYATEDEIATLERNIIALRDSAFTAMIEAFNKLTFLRIIRSINPGIENVSKFERRYDWSDIMMAHDQNVYNLFDALLIINVLDEDKFHSLLSALPISPKRRFRVRRVYLYTGGVNEGLGGEKESTMFDLELAIDTGSMTDQFAARHEFNAYFDDIRVAIEKYSNT